MLRSTPSLPFQVLGEPETTVHAVDDTVSADPKGQVNRLEPTPSKSRPTPLECYPLELALELTDCCVRVLTTSALQRVSACILNLP